MYTFNVKLTEADYYEFNKFQMKHDPASKRTRAVTRVFVLAVIGIYIILSLIYNAERAEFAEVERPVMLAATVITCIILFGVLAGVSFLLDLLLTPLFIKMSINATKKKGKLAFDEYAAVAFDEDSFTETTADAVNTAKYSKIEKICYTDSAIYIFLNAQMAQIIPLSVFESDEQRSAFWVFINQKKDTAANES
jgi:hypothetical protein